ncbi:hypothetical protein [Sunxiuqinia elliptica]|uniref:Uncharacterized protein n=1 Tax=Sunxiuqinia elliptica TaxID=655355 RepID=A0A1I2K3B8_9BACT|nr:hypothetical protein [Sunxiuqinia elliptica]SFF60913.1 hypothetical protein SAMN05216283_110143 [Sunxiuqinia elliptica]
MKKVFFYTILILFLIITLTTLSGIVGIIPQINDKYLDKLFYSLIISLVSAVIFLFKKTDFFTDNKTAIRKREYKAFGYEYLDYTLEDTLYLDGTSISVADVKIKCIVGEVKSQSHLVSTYCDHSIEDVEIIFSANSNDSIRKINYEMEKSEKNIVSVKVNFSPSLKKGEIAEYKITTKSKGLYKLYFEDVVDGIKDGTHFCNIPMECHGLITKTPISNLVVKMNLPRKYQITDCEYFDVFPGTSYERSESEYNYIKENDSFKFINNSNDYVSLVLNVSRPVVGMTYVVKWTPPKKNNNVPQHAVKNIAQEVLI